MIYFTSDTHFGDTRFNLFYRNYNSVEEQDNALINIWNSKVTPDDTVIHLGDVSYSKDGIQQASKLNGYKILIKGNYDDQFTDDELLQYFDKVYSDKIINIRGQRFYFNHYPEKGRCDMFNIVGHIHSLWKVQRNMINVGIDCWKTMVSEDQLFFTLDAIKKHYDINVFAGELTCNDHTSE